MCGAVLESIAVVAGFQNMAVMREPVQQRRGHLGIPEHTGPFAETQIGGDHNAGALGTTWTTGGTARRLLMR